MTTSTTPPDTDRSSTSDGGSRWVDSRKSTPTTRLRPRSRRRLPHLLLGALLVVACAATFVLISVHAGDRRPVLALARTVTVGQVLTAQDLRQVNVSVDVGVRVIDARQTSTVVGQTMTTSVPVGALLTPEAVGTSEVPVAGQAIAALSLDPGQFPPEVSPGAHVTLVVVSTSPGGPTGSAPPPVPESAWPAVVTSVTEPPGTRITVVSAQLSETDAGEVAAVPAGQLSLVMRSGGDR